MCLLNPPTLVANIISPKTRLLFLLLTLLAISLFFRTYNFVEWYEFGHDNDLSAWIFKSMALDGNPRLIGQLTSIPGLFIGPLFYYLLVPLYLVGDLNPLPTLAYSWFVGLFATFSFFYVLSKIHGKKVGMIAAIIHASSFAIVMTEREVVPTTPVFLWSIWFYYACARLTIPKPNSLLLLAALFALVWHIQFNLFPLVIVPLLIFMRHFRRLGLKQAVIPLLLFTTLSTPLIVFELRHHFPQLTSLLITGAYSPVSRSPVDNLWYVLSYVARNTNAVFVSPSPDFSGWLIPVLVTLALAYLLFSRALSFGHGFILIFWTITSIGLFIFKPVILSEYYLNNLVTPAVIVISLFFSRLARKAPLAAIGFICAFLAVNIARFTAHTSNYPGYLPKMSLIEYILRDSQVRGFNCVSYSFITHPGFDLGYRYLTWLSGLKLSPVSANAPVYTIVFPLYLVNKIDFSFGPLGLILPDYSRYPVAAANCPEIDYNLTSPMFGFVN